jgi:protein-S-isoprenylcysteine O-methyltransferase Ste14
MGPALKTLVFSVVAPGAVAAGFPWLLVHGQVRIEPGPGAFAGLALVALGAACYAACALDFVVTGRGTPAPLAPCQTLVVRRLYRFVRNPMYIAVLLALLGETAALRSATLAVYTAMIALLFHLFVLLYEEPALRAQFGPSFDAYCATVPRWLPAAH